MRGADSLYILMTQLQYIVKIKSRRFALHQAARLSSSLLDPSWPVSPPVSLLSSNQTQKCKVYSIDNGWNLLQNQRFRYPLQHLPNIFSLYVLNSHSTQVLPGTAISFLYFLLTLPDIFQMDMAVGLGNDPSICHSLSYSNGRAEMRPISQS